ncbi:hypothetical protein HPB49_005945 [Dermacentor silvarum]|uniref:Uncharacterized protein n=1 Tax=Dermacentor silvarum TaxID=543639 RepID=A0ACB8DW10_DERSI|nr:hypothetical protein HPB49_005945 [Dermacentor silvarum]
MKHRIKRHLHHGNSTIIISAEHAHVVRATSEQNALSFTDRAGRRIHCSAHRFVPPSYRNLQDRMRDCAKVDLSLRGPGKCIDTLSKNGTQPVSYGGSKPTHNFKDSLGDSRRGLMIAAVTLSKVRYLEACNTLNYAERAVQMKPQVNKNVLNANGHISVYSALIEDYKEEVEGLQLKREKAKTENTVPGTEEEVVDGLLVVASLLHSPDWRLATTVRRKSTVLPSGNLGDSFEGFTTDGVFIRFPNWPPHPHQRRRSGSADVVAASATPMATSWSPMQSSAANETFVSDTQRLRVLDLILSPQPSTSNVRRRRCERA